MDGKVIRVRTVDSTG